MAHLTGQPLQKEEGSGTALLLELFCWNAINICELAFSYTRFVLCGDTLTTAHGQHAERSVPVCQEGMVTLVYHSHAVAAKLTYLHNVYSPGFLGKKTTSVTAPYQTLPLCEGRRHEATSPVGDKIKLFNLQ